MKIRMLPNIPLAIVISAAVAAVALRAAARQPKPRWMLGAEPAPVTATADDSEPQPAVTTGMQGTAGHGTAKPPGAPGRPDSAVEQMQYIFHELHADGHNALCGVCDSQYWRHIEETGCRTSP
jgi:hypothetical protein